MKPEVQNVGLQKTPSKYLSRKVIIISLISFILLMLAVTAQFSYMILNYDKVYQGVYINKIYAGNLSKEALRKLLKSNFTDKTKNLEITLKCKNLNEKLSYMDARVNYDVENAINLAYSVGRSGNIFIRFSDILKARRSNVTVDMPISLDNKKVEGILQNIYNKTFIGVKEADLLIQEDKITIRSGHHGENIDKDKVFKEIEQLIQSSSSKTIDIPIVITAPSKINVNEYYSQITRDVRDAAFKVEDNKLEILPELPGRSINKEDLEKIASELEKTENKEMVLPVSFIKPAVTVNDVHTKLFKDTLFTVKTHFNTNTQNNKNRAYNIKLASSKINGKMLAPGEIFSFNDTVGERTKAAGYKDAYVYKSGKVVPDLAGGICQVSSTLYNAVLQSGFEVIERRNHMFIVTYVKPGTDATIFGNSTDFKFRNSTGWPIKIESSLTKDNYLVFSIRGTNENPGRTIEVSSVIKNQKDFAIKTINDPNLPEGQKKILQEGHKGLTVDTYKIVKLNGKVIETSKIATSVYQPLAQEEAKGTKKIPAISIGKVVQKTGTDTTKPTSSNPNVSEPLPNPGDTVDPGQ